MFDLWRVVVSCGRWLPVVSKSSFCIRTRSESLVFRVHTKRKLCHECTWHAQPSTAVRLNSFRFSPRTVHPPLTTRDLIKSRILSLFLLVEFMHQLDPHLNERTRRAEINMLALAISKRRNTFPVLRMSAARRFNSTTSAAQTSRQRPPPKSQGLNQPKAIFWG